MKHVKGFFNPISVGVFALLLLGVLATTSCSNPSNGDLGAQDRTVIIQHFDCNGGLMNTYAVPTNRYSVGNNVALLETGDQSIRLSGGIIIVTKPK